MSLTAAIKSKANALGFELVGVAPAGPVPELAFYKEWIEAGYSGSMSYLERNADKRQDVTQVVPEAKSVIACGKIYHTPHALSTECPAPERGWISRYGWGDDYHDVLRNRLFELSDFIDAESAEPVTSRLYVDTGPVVDRVFAKYAGIGWFGKNTCIINQQHGSWFFLGEIITSLDLETDSPAPDRCGTCTRCIDACPTEAILEPYVLDARRCISYLTIELKEEIPVELRDGIGNHVFGCDICQDVCPWNGKATDTREPALQPKDGLVNPDLEWLAGLSEDSFRELFRRSPVRRSKYRGLMRNVAVALGNSGSKRFLPLLEKMANSEAPLIAEHAKWAIAKLNANPKPG